MEILNIEGSNLTQIEIIDSNGKRIQTINKEQTNKPINIKNLTKGIYFIKVYTEKGLTTKKIIIQ